MGKHAKLKEKQKSSEENIHLENAIKLRGIYFIDPEDTEFKETIKNARKKLETLVAPAVLVKLRRIVGVVHPTKFKQNLRVFWKLMNPQEWVWETRYRRTTKTILQGKVRIHYSTTIWFKFILMPQAVKIPAAKAAVDKEWEKLEKISAGYLTSQK